jgi:hypothetical protein
MAKDMTPTRAMAEAMARAIRRARAIFREMARAVATMLQIQHNDTQYTINCNIRHKQTMLSITRHGSVITSD